MTTTSILLDKCSDKMGIYIYIYIAKIPAKDLIGGSHPFHSNHARIGIHSNLGFYFGVIIVTGIQKYQTRLHLTLDLLVFGRRCIITRGCCDSVLDKRRHATNEIIVIRTIIEYNNKVIYNNIKQLLLITIIITYLKAIVDML